ncbi:AhpC/TSA family protein [Crocinitomicaceae bacterium]|nr:AhpC/TSA family protein [Crocinitomicaceae bacterium]
MLKIPLTIFTVLISLVSFAQTETINTLKIGDKAPLFEAISYSNNEVKLKNLIDSGKVVLVFYRGAWCPYCNKHMSNLQDSLNLIIEKGASLITISPEVESSVEESISKSNATFEIISDKNYQIMNQYGVSFKVKEAILTKYKLFGINLEEANGNDDNILPVPATFIINQNGTIEYIHFDENYKERLSVSEIIKHL